MSIFVENPHLRHWRRMCVLGPTVVYFGFFFLWPLLDIVVRSLNTHGALSIQDISLDNYAALIGDSVLRQVMLETFRVSAISAIITAAAAFPVAYLISRVSKKVASALLVVVMIPFWVSILIRLFALTQVLGRHGFVNTLSNSLGLGGPYDLLFNTGSVVVGMCAYLLPFMVFVLHSAMSGIDDDVITAAKSLGGSTLSVFARIYFPLVRPGLTAGLLLVFVLALGFFLTPAILGGPSNMTVPLFIQTQINTFQWGRASASGVLLLIVTLGCFLIAVRLSGLAVIMGSGAQGSKGTSRTNRLHVSLGTFCLWAIFALVLIFLYLPLLVVIPESFSERSILIWPPEGFTLKWYANVFESRDWIDAVIKSALVGMGTALLSTGLGLALARTLGQMANSLPRRGMEALIFLPVMTPVILLAIGEFDFQAQVGLLGSNVGLILAHTLLTLPFSFVVLSTALSKVDSTIEEASWASGASLRRTFARIVVPVITPSIVASFLISFATSWDEVVLALFQTGFSKTLPVLIFSYIRTGVTPEVAAVASMLISLVLFALAAMGVYSTLSWYRTRALRQAKPGRAGHELVEVTH